MRAKRVGWRLADLSAALAVLDALIAEQEPYVADEWQDDDYGHGSEAEAKRTLRRLRAHRDALAQRTE